MNATSGSATHMSASHLPALGAHERSEVGHALQATLVDLVDLSLIGKQLHWNVTGPLFRPLHLQLDELVDAWRELSDTVAERAVALGVAPDGQAAAITRDAQGEAIEAAPIEDRAVIGELTRRLAQVAESTRSRLERVGELDLASQDVLIEVLRTLEKQLWMVRAQYGGA